MAAPEPRPPSAFAAALQPDGRPATPRDSASVLVLDGSTTPWRVLMLRRPGGADFAPGAWVFPGGSVAAEDETRSDRLRAAAVRELWEEAGLLLARRSTGRRLAAATDAGRVREAVSAGSGFWEALSDLRLEATPERLVPVTRWITPVGLRRRFDTRFYAVRAPRQPVVPQLGEVTEWRWVTAAEALSAGPELVYATRRILELVSPVADASVLLRRLRGRVERPPVLPRIVAAGGRTTVVDDAAPLFP